ncbi:MAG TPA: PepSY-associated TM helix domain-containing protein [Arachidicoccus sp.]|nr:PepSY-associated TM helix domain-containing protein [Arachidicoccus sp.]
MPINKKSKVNRAITWLHLWLGLVSGIIVLIVSITGCLFSFQEEITNWVHKDELFVQPPSAQTAALPLSTLTEKAKTALGIQRPITYINTYADRNRSWEFMSYVPGDKNAITFPGTIKVYESVFVNPYTGVVTGEINYMKNFFVIVKYIHWSLYLNDAYGQPIVGWSTLIFVILLITGVIMWFPKRWKKKHIDNSFKVRWKAKFKRLNYDLHNVLGFYTFLIALIIGLTGMVFSFRWFQKAVYATSTLSTQPVQRPAYASDTTATASLTNPVDKAFALTKSKYPAARRYSTNPVADKAAPMVFSAYTHKSTYYHANQLYFDQYTGNEVGKLEYKDLNAGEKVLAMNYDIHVGAIGGLIGKIIAFLVSLVCASLPVTGFIIWWGKRKKQHKKYRKQARVWQKYQDQKNGFPPAVGHKPQLEEPVEG